MASSLHLHIQCIPSFSQSGLDGDRDWRYPSCGNKVQTHPLSAELPVLLKTAVVHHWPHVCLHLDGLVSSVFVWQLFANCLALIDESFASTVKLDVCGLLLPRYAVQASLRRRAECVNSGQILDKVWCCTASDHPL